MAKKIDKPVEEEFFDKIKDRLDKLVFELALESDLGILGGVASVNAAVLLLSVGTLKVHPGLEFVKTILKNELDEVMEQLENETNH